MHRDCSKQMNAAALSRVPAGSGNNVQDETTSIYCEGRRARIAQIVCSVQLNAAVQLGDKVVYRR